MKAFYVYLASLPEGEQFIFGDRELGYCHTVLKKVYSEKKKALIEVKNPGSHSYLTKKKEYELSLTSDPKCIPVVIVYFSDMKEGAFFFSQDGHICKRITAGSGKTRCINPHEMKKRKSYFADFNDVDKVYIPNPECQ